MVVKLIFIFLVISNLILNIIKTYYDRKIETLKESEAVATQKDVHTMHNLMSKTQTTGNNIFMITIACGYLVFKATGTLRIASMILLVSSFFIAYAIDIIIQRRDSIRRIKQLEKTLTDKNIDL